MADIEISLGQDTLRYIGMPFGFLPVQNTRKTGHTSLNSLEPDMIQVRQKFTILSKKNPLCRLENDLAELQHGPLLFYVLPTNFSPERAATDDITGMSGIMTDTKRPQPLLKERASVELEVSRAELSSHRLEAPEMVRLQAELVISSIYLHLAASLPKG
ncbi:hypothetical protein B0H10DRAFT_1949338 [Mycena sp. CBHHK59/15]|nr:hypothetical protein B0H10DRAFT_1959152 [Mycena sp. CBHHK59/15]KAJ6616126.1 hypothetical protein B0H10DRAFT_1949338 [Mycena sp. CBHHK59/15]